MRLMKVIGVLLAGALLGAAAGAALWYESGSGQPASVTPAAWTTPLAAAPAPVVDAPAPDFSLPDLIGRELTLSELRGTPVILNFWATWCEPCREELPLLNQVAGEHRDDLAVLAVNTGESAAEIRLFVEPLALASLRLVSDPSGAVRDRYLVRGLPTSFFLDAAGIVRRIKIGTLSTSEIDSILANMGATS
jgi:cytochrome c biogenesis protein CcmG/thiol:disulfide interchange protein DsbE